jgi:hypothetical protein
MIKIIIILAIISMVGCKTTEESNALEEKKGKARIELFKKCMELSAKITRQADDDVSDIVNECSQQSYYMTNHVT